MKFNKVLLISSIVLLSLLVIGAVSASEDVNDAIGVSEVEEIQTIDNVVNQDNNGIIANDDDDEASALEEIETTEDIKKQALGASEIESGEENIDVLEAKEIETDDEPIVGAASNDDSLAASTDDAPVLGDTKTSKIDVYVDGKFVNSFSYTHGENGFTFGEILEILNMSEVDLSSFGNFADMFATFSSVNFTDESAKIFDFKIDGEVGKIKYNLGVLSNSTDFNFDYSISTPNQNNEAITGKVISIYSDGALVKNLTLVSKGSTAFNFGNMMDMSSMSSINMSEYMSMFNSSGKNFDVKIAGEVGVVKYSLVMIQNETGFVFDYKIYYPVVNVALTAKNITATAVNTNVDGKIGKYLTLTLKDVWGLPLVSKIIQISLNGKVYKVKTNSNGVAKLQLNLAKAGTYYATVCYLGDETHPAVMQVIKIVIKKQTPKLTVSKKTYKAKAKTKKLTAKFLTSKGKAIKSKKISFKVKGKTYTAKTNAKGIATVKVKLTKKGKYTFTAKFAGDNTYKAISKKAKLTLK